MKEMIYKIMSMTMAFLLLLSTTSWKVEKHYCMGRLIDVAFFVPADDCGMDMDMPSNEEQKVKKEESCCNDEVVVIDGQDHLKLSIDDLTADQQFFLIAFSYSYSNLFKELAERVVPHKQYPPPLLVKDIQVLGQIFLI